MAAITEAILGINYGRPLGEDGWNTDYNDFALKMSTLVMLNAISATTTAEPTTPTDGDVYLLPTSCTGTDWAGNDNTIGRYVVDTWVFYSHHAGFRAFVDDDDQVYVSNGTSFSLEGSTYGQYADDSAAATGSVPVGGKYVNSSTGAIHVRLT